MALVSNLVFYFSSCFRIGFLIVVVAVLIHIGFSSASNSS